MDTYCSLITWYTIPKGGQCPVSIELNSSPVRMTRNYDLEIHAWLNTFIQQRQVHKSKIAKLYQHNVSQWEDFINDESSLKWRS